MLESLPISWNHVHPVLVHFTTALLPVSLVCDLAGKYLKRESLTAAGWTPCGSHCYLGPRLREEATALELSARA